MNLITLFEMDWYDKTPLVAVLKANRGRWIHFSQGAPNRDYAKATLLPDPVKPSDGWNVKANKQYQRDLLKVQRQNAIAKVPKIGINPKSFWKDPKGVYFYPCDWLLGGAERIRIAQQHGLDYPNYYLADLNLNDPAGVNLGTVTWDQVTEIARRNGWLDIMVAFRSQPLSYQKTELGSYSRPETPGSFFWHFVDREVKGGRMSWLKAYYGVSFVRDPNLSIIHSNEPDQVLVINPKIIKNVTLATNQPVGFQNREKMEHWMFALMTVIKAVRGDYGGTLIWEKKKPKLSFEKGMGKFNLTIAASSYSASGMEPGLTMTYTYGRAENSMSVGRKDLETKTSEQIVDLLKSKVDFISRLRTDLLFKPVMTIADGKVYMKNRLSNLSDLEITETIHNSEGPDKKWSSVSMYGKLVHEVEGLSVETTIYTRLYADRMSMSVKAKLGLADLIYASPQGDTPTLDDVANAAITNFDTMFERYAPARQASKYRSNALFPSDEDQFACAGWIIKNCGINLDGALERHYHKQIAAFEAKSEREQADLIREMRWVLTSRY